MTKDLYTTEEIKKVRKQMYDEQQGLCLLSKVKVDFKDTHLDHAHDTKQLVRGALHKQANMALGKLENLYMRYLGYWYPGKLSDFLRSAADYLDKPEDTRFRHVGWQKKLQTMFNKLNASQQKQCLELLGLKSESNPLQRKSVFAVAVKQRALGYNKIFDAMQNAQDAQTAQRSKDVNQD